MGSAALGRGWPRDSISQVQHLQQAAEACSMKVIIAGSRTIHTYSLVAEAVRQSGYTISEVVCGMGLGVD